MDKYWYKNLYCSNVWTAWYRYLRKFYTISKIDILPFFLCILIASITPPNVPVLPIPALQCTHIRFFFSISLRHISRIYSNLFMFDSTGFFRSDQPIHYLKQHIHEYELILIHLWGLLFENWWLYTLDLMSQMINFLL